MVSEIEMREALKLSFESCRLEKKKRKGRGERLKEKFGWSVQPTPFKKCASEV